MAGGRGRSPWLDQQAARVAEQVPLRDLLDAFHDDDIVDDGDLDEVVLGRLVVATAIIAKAMPPRIDAR